MCCNRPTGWVPSPSPERLQKAYGRYPPVLMNILKKLMVAQVNALQFKNLNLNSSLCAFDILVFAMSASRRTASAGRSKRKDVQARRGSDMTDIQK